MLGLSRGSICWQCSSLFSFFASLPPTYFSPPTSLFPPIAWQSGLISSPAHITPERLPYIFHGKMLTVGGKKNFPVLTFHLPPPSFHHLTIWSHPSQSVFFSCEKLYIIWETKLRSNERDVWLEFGLVRRLEWNTLGVEEAFCQPLHVPYLLSLNCVATAGRRYSTVALCSIDCGKVTHWTVQFAAVYCFSSIVHWTIWRRQPRTNPTKPQHNNSLLAKVQLHSSTVPLTVQCSASHLLCLLSEL